MQTVYGVSSGEYSDYCVGPIFRRREDAEEFVAHGGGDRVEEFSLFDLLPERFTIYSASYTLLPGLTEGFRDSVREGWGGLDDQPSLRPKVDVHRYSNGGLIITATGADRDAVLKSVRDRWATEQARRDVTGESALPT